jgi:SAM-dependent methyltransferase
VNARPAGRVRTRRRACPCCGASAPELLYAQRFSGVAGGSLLAGYDVVVCRACGFGFADNLPDQQEFDAYYRRMSKYENPQRGGELSAFDLRRYAQTAAVIAGVVPDRAARILDIGCATGGLLGQLRLLGYTRLLGLDPSPACGEIAARLHGVQVAHGALGDLPADAGLFDAVVLGSVLEHVRDLAGALRRVRALLVPGGHLYVEVPDAAAFACVRRDPPYQEFSTEHINYFSSVSLANLMAANGFGEVFSRPTRLELAPGIDVHDIKAAFRLDPGAHRTLLPDRVTAPSLRAYIAASARAEAGLAAVIDRVITARLPLIVWGVGTLTQHLLAAGNLARADIRAFVDSDPRYQGKDIGGVPVLSPAQLAGRSEAILISTLVYQDEITRHIRGELGLDNEVVVFAPDDAVAPSG